MTALATLRTKWALSFAAVALPVAAFAACSSGDATGPTPLATTNDASTTGTKTRSSGDGGGTSGGDAAMTPFDAGVAQPAIDTLCAEAKQLGQEARELMQPGLQYPATGGAFVAGTYTLDGLYKYVGGVSDAGPIVENDAGDDAGDDDDDDDDDDDGGNIFGDSGEPRSGEATTSTVEEKTLVLESSGLFSLVSASGTVDAGLGPAQISAGIYQLSGTAFTLHATCPAASDVTYPFTASGSLIELYEPGGIIEVFRQVAVP